MNECPMSHGFQEWRTCFLVNEPTFAYTYSVPEAWAGICRAYWKDVWPAVAGTSAILQPGALGFAARKMSTRWREPVAVTCARARRKEGVSRGMAVGNQDGCADRWLLSHPAFDLRQD